MNSLAPYLFFKGNCREAMKFYEKIFGGELNVMTFKDAQGGECPKGSENLVIHAHLKHGTFVMMASDAPGEKIQTGENVHLSLNCASMNEIETFFKALSEGGKVEHALHDTFWGARFGTLTDRYGFHWMLNFEKPR